MAKNDEKDKDEKAAAAAGAADTEPPPSDEAKPKGGPKKAAKAPEPEDDPERAQRYKVVHGCLHAGGGTYHQVGEVVSLMPSEAAPLLKDGVIKLHRGK